MREFIAQPAVAGRQPDDIGATARFKAGSMRGRLAADASLRIAGIVLEAPVSGRTRRRSC
jgi:hypothetical protein